MVMPENFNHSSSSSTTATPFYSRKHYKEIVNEILDQITKGVTKEIHTFKASQLEYHLGFRPISSIVKIEGKLDGREHHTFGNDSYHLLQDSKSMVLAWKEGAVKPDEGTDFEVTYISHEPSGLTDTNPGSVLRTIVEAISKELDQTYNQMDRVYQSGFIDTAKGDALDNIAVIVGMVRKPPTLSTGYVTFWRDSDPPEIVVSGETVLYDGRDNYILKEDRLKTITAVKGLVKGVSHSFSKGKDYTEAIPAIKTENGGEKKNSIVWLLGGTKPDNNTPFSVDYIVYERIFVPRGTIVSTFAAQPSNIKLFETLQDAELQKSEDNNNKWKVEVEIRALEPGQQGNVIAGAITLMPKPPIGVEHVVNRSNLEGGADREDDEVFRSRAKKALEFAGKATIGSLRTALQSIEGIQSPPMIRENPDGIPGLVKVVLEGGEEKDILKVIEDTRAAGVRVEFFRPKVVSLDFYITVVAGKRIATAAGPSIESLRSLINGKIKDFVFSLEIGEELVYNQLLSTVLTLEGLSDLKQMVIEVYREGLKSQSSSNENISVTEDERLYPRTVEVRVEQQIISSANKDRDNKEATKIRT
jgi:uncharacterized phage protein gp47/JayE